MMADLSWLRAFGPRSRTPNPALSSSRDDRDSIASDASHRSHHLRHQSSSQLLSHGMRPRPLRKMSSKLSLNIGGSNSSRESRMPSAPPSPAPSDTARSDRTRSNTGRSFEAPSDITPSSRTIPFLWPGHKVVRTLESLQQIMMRLDPRNPIPVTYTTHVLLLLEAVMDARSVVQKNQEELRELELAHKELAESKRVPELDELKEVRERELEEFRGISEEWMQRENAYKEEIKRLEMVLMKEGAKGMESVALVRAETLVDRSGSKRFQARLKRLGRDEEGAQRKKYVEPSMTRRESSQRQYCLRTTCLEPAHEVYTTQAMRMQDDTSEDGSIREKTPKITCRHRHEATIVPSSRGQPPKVYRPTRPRRAAACEHETAHATSSGFDSSTSSNYSSICTEDEGEPMIRDGRAYVTLSSGGHVNVSRTNDARSTQLSFRQQREVAYDKPPNSTIQEHRSALSGHDPTIAWINSQRTDQARGTMQQESTSYAAEQQVVGAAHQHLGFLQSDGQYQGKRQSGYSFCAGEDDSLAVFKSAWNALDAGHSLARSTSGTSVLRVKPECSTPDLDTQFNASLASFKMSASASNSDGETLICPSGSTGSVVFVGGSGSGGSRTATPNPNIKRLSATGSFRNHASTSSRSTVIRVDSERENRRRSGLQAIPSAFTVKDVEQETFRKGSDEFFSASSVRHQDCHSTSFERNEKSAPGTDDKRRPGLVVRNPSSMRSALATTSGAAETGMTLAARAAAMAIAKGGQKWMDEREGNSG